MNENVEKIMRMIYNNERENNRATCTKKVAEITREFHSRLSVNERDEDKRKKNPEKIFDEARIR